MSTHSSVPHSVHRRVLRSPRVGGARGQRPDAALVREEEQRPDADLIDGVVEHDTRSLAAVVTAGVVLAVFVVGCAVLLSQVLDVTAWMVSSH